MKKILIFMIALCFSAAIYGQATIGAGGTWATARGIINSNFLLMAPKASPTFTGTVTLPTSWKIGAVTVTANGQELNILDGALVTYQELNKLVGIGTDTIATRAYARSVAGSGGGDLSSSDTAAMLADYINKADTASMLSDYINKADTALMLNHYALLSEVGDGASMVYPAGSGIPIVASGSSWGTTITNNSTVWDRAGIVGNATAAPYFDGSSDGGQILTFYGNNGFWTALQGGAPLANRSYRLPIDAYPSAGATSLMNMDENGNMGLIASNLTSFLTQTAWRVFYSDGSGDVKELALGADGTYLKSNGASSAPSFATPTSTGITAGDTASMLSHYSTLSEARDIVNDSLSLLRSEAFELSTIANLNTDTIPLFGISGGNGLRGSQPSFLLQADLGGISNASVKDTMYITSARLFTKQDSGTVTMGLRFYKHATTWPTSASTDMMSGVITLSAATNATTTGTVITHSSTPYFSTFVVYPGESVAAIVTVKSNGNMPVLVRGIVYGYTQNRRY